MICKCLSSHVDNPPLYRDKKWLPEKILKPAACLWHLFLTESCLARHSWCFSYLCFLAFYTWELWQTRERGKCSFVFLQCPASFLLAFFLMSLHELVSSFHLPFFSFIFSFLFFNQTVRQRGWVTSGYIFAAAWIKIWLIGRTLALAMKESHRLHHQGLTSDSSWA